MKIFNTYLLVPIGYEIIYFANICYRFGGLRVGNPDFFTFFCHASFLKGPHGSHASLLKYDHLNLRQPPLEFRGFTKYNKSQIL